MHKLEINGGRVSAENGYFLQLPPQQKQYGNAQIDDYAGLKRKAYLWRPDVQLSLQAQFSHAAYQLQGTAGFGFWNAPFGDPTVPRPALPQAAWFFHGSPPNDLPLAPLSAQGNLQAGQGWFAATLDATRWAALALIPAAPFVMLGNRWQVVRQRVWPQVQESLGISYAQLTHDMTEWHHYELRWGAAGCTFWIDGQAVLTTHLSPRGPLGFVCWVDNQYMVATPTGRFRWGTVSTATTQWLRVKELHISGEVRSKK